jgi:hypothetical protein
MEDFIQRQSPVIFARDVAKPLSSLNRAASVAGIAVTKNAKAMTRLSKHEIRNGRVWNGFDYKLQVWVVNGNIQHPDTMRSPKNFCCNAYRLAGRSILGVPNAQRRDGRGDPNLLTKSHGLSQTPSGKAS